jgi:nicotinamidase-related amidase
LDILLNHLDAETLILAGFAGNICVLFTANDAYMRNFKLIVPKDCIGSNTAEVNSRNKIFRSKLCSLVGK